MLPPFIIEQIRRREQEDARRDQRPMVEVPRPPARPREVETEERDRGVIVIDLG